MTVQNLIDEIARKILGNASNADTDFTNLALDAIKSALRRLPRFTRAQCLIETDYTTLLSGTQELDISSITGFVSIKEIYYVDDGERYEIKKYEGKFSDVYSSEDDGEPAFYQLRGNVITFDRLANQDYTIYLVYYATPDNDISASDTLSLRNDILEIIKDGALAYVWDNLEDDNKSAKAENRFISGLSKIEEDYYRDITPEYINETMDL